MISQILRSVLLRYICPVIVVLVVISLIMVMMHIDRTGYNIQPARAHDVSRSVSFDIMQRNEFFKANAANRYLENRAHRSKTLRWIETSLLRQVDCVSAVRVGSVADGGKWICNPWYLPTNCTIFSLGIDSEITFEGQLQSLYPGRCNVFGFDHTVAADPYTDIPNSSFYRYKISNHTSRDQNVYSIPDLMTLLKVSYVDVLKVDIEGDEADALLAVMDAPSDAYHPANFACQILIEIHGWEKQRRWWTLLASLEKAQFWLFSREPSPSDLNVYELSYIHQHCLEQYGVTGPFLKNFDGT